MKTAGSLILNTTSRIIMAILLVFSVFLLIRGHNLPGGGFSGGLVAAAAFAVHCLAFGAGSARRLLRWDPRSILATGLIIALVSGLFALPEHLPFMTGLWEKTPLPVLGKVGTPLLFDLGVFFVVLGVVLVLVFTLAEEEEDPWN
jgi:multicomponent Na+:H+ antiporter subunit B